MQLLKALSIGLAGMAAGIALIVACGDDDTPPDATAADAAECNRPAPQPIEERIRSVTQQSATDTNDGFSLETSCQSLSLGALVLGGSCDAGVLDGQPLYLKTARAFASHSWLCNWQNPTHTAGITLKATAICLVPEGTPLPAVDAGL